MACRILMPLARASRVPTTALLVLGSCILASALPIDAVAQDSRGLTPTTAAPMSLVRLDAPIVLDGRIDEPAWAGVQPLPLSQFQPDPGGPMRERSEIRVAYDDTYLYAAGRFWDSDRHGIRANSLLRDHYAEDDFLNLVIDTFHDRESAVWFIVTPNATRIDGSISNDAQGPESQWNHREYDMPWEAAATPTDEGWSVEIRIPFSALRFSARDGQMTMGLIAARVISRRKERHIFPAIRPTVAAAQFRPSLAAPVTLTIGSAPRLFAFTPYVIGGRQSRPGGAGAGATEPARIMRTLHEAGADLKLGLSSRLTLDLTLNTDFAQTEVDDQRVNLTRFSLFFPERRQFFLERSGLFDVTLGGNDRIFHSRRIGLGPQGDPMRVLGGGRLVGRIGAWDLGALDMLVDEGSGDAPANAAVIRARRNVLNPYSYVGAVAATSSGTADGHSVAADGTLRLTAADFLVWSVATTWGGAGVMDAPGGDGSAFRFAWENRRRAGLSASSELRVVGERFRPALGFVERTDAAMGSAGARYGWVGVRGATQERSLGVTGTVVRALSTGEVETVSAGPTATVVLLDGANATVTVRERTEVLADTFRLSATAKIDPGRHDWREFVVSGSTAPGALARLAFEVGAGGFYDRRRLTVALRPSWSASRHLELAGDLEVNRVWLPASDERFVGDVIRVRSRVAIDPRLSLTGGIQYNRATSVMRGSLRLRLALREGTDLFVVVDEERLEADRARLAVPGVPGARYFAAKYRYTFR